jgi:hypothetical protein
MIAGELVQAVIYAVPTYVPRRPENVGRVRWALSGSVRCDDNAIILRCYYGNDMDLVRIILPDGAVVTTSASYLCALD